MSFSLPCPDLSDMTDEFVIRLATEFTVVWPEGPAIARPVTANQFLGAKAELERRRLQP